MSDLEIVISDDEMAGYVVVPQDCGLSIREIAEELEKHGVIYGVSHEAIANALHSHRGSSFQVAFGFRPNTPSKDSFLKAPRFIPSFPQSKGKPIDTIPVDEGFRLTWRRLSSRGRVREGMSLGSLRYPENSLQQITVTGKRIPCFAGKILLIPGENAYLSEDGTSIIAKKKGIPYYLEDNTAGVMDRVVIGGDISSLTQDIEFPGDLIIRGSIQREFSVSAWGSIMVDGSVFGSVSCAGDLLVSGGINGLGQVIEVGGSISARFLENAVVRAWGQINISEVILHSVAESEDRITVSDLSGRIVGGLIRAKNGVRTGISGTHLGIPGVIEVGLSPRDRRELSRLNNDLERISAEISRLEMIMPKGSVFAKDSGSLDKLRAQRELKLLGEREKSTLEKKTSLEEKLSKNLGGFFWAQKVYPGTRVFRGLQEAAMPRNPGPVRIGDMPDETH